MYKMYAPNELSTSTCMTQLLVNFNGFHSSTYKIFHDIINCNATFLVGFPASVLNLKQGSPPNNNPLGFVGQTRFLDTSVKFEGLRRILNITISLISLSLLVIM